MIRLRTKRVYEPPEPADGKRILVDRLWPRGLSKTEARIDLWARELAPSDELRRWYGHDPRRWEEFRRRYRAELETRSAQVKELLAFVGKGPATLLYAAKDATRHNAQVLLEHLEAQLRGRRGRRRPARSGAARARPRERS